MRFIVALLSCVAVAACCLQPAAAQAAGQASNGGADLKAQRKALFQRMLAKPDDLDSAFEYAALSVKAGDLEGAVATLERMLIYSPGLPRLQLELGVLYFRLGAPESARAYFEAALAASPPPEVRQKVTKYLAAINKEMRSTAVSAEVRTGLRYQSDANRAPLGRTIVLNGIPFQLDTDSTGKSDFNVYGAAAVNLSYDLPSQNDTLDVGAFAYGAKQFRRDELDTALTEVRVGPTFDLGRFNIDDATLGVYGIGSGVLLEDSVYSAATGAGARLAATPNNRFAATLRSEYRHRFYIESASHPTVGDREGNEFLEQGYISYLVRPDVALNVSALAQRTTAKAGYYADWEAGGSAGVTISLASPFKGAAPWKLGVHGGALWRLYDAPDPLINVAEAEADTELFARSSLTVPIKNGWGILGETEFRNVNSNYPTRQFHNLSATLSVVKNW